MFVQQTRKLFLWVILGSILTLNGILFVSPQPVHAVDCDKIGETAIVLQIAIPRVTKECDKKTLVIKGASPEEVTVKQYYVTGLEQYISGIYNFFIGAISLAAIVMIMVGGFQWMLSAGNQSRIGNAKSTIASATGGLVLALLSYTILNTINPRITSLDIEKPSAVAKIQQTDFFCSEIPNNIIPDNTLLTPVAFDVSKECPPVITPAACQKLKNDASKTKAATKCGQLYKHTDNTGKPLSNSCVGQDCTGNPNGSACHKGACVNGILTGSITADSGRHINSTLALVAVCEKGTKYYASGGPGAGTTVELNHLPVTIASQELGNSSLQTNFGYVFSERPGANLCAGSSVVGYYLEAEVRDDSNFGILSIDDNFAIGKAGNAALFTCADATNAQKYDPACPLVERITDPAIMNWGVIPTDSLKALLIPHEPVKAGSGLKTGFEKVNISITTGAFPAR